jgi:hypothetical protein
MLVAIGDSLSDLARCDDGDDGEEEDNEETEQGKVSEDDEPGWVMGTITKTGQQRMAIFCHKQMKFTQLTQPGWEDAADYFPEHDKKYGTAELRVRSVVQPKRMMSLPSILRQHLQLLWRVLTLSPEYRKGLLDQEVVISG